MFNYYIPMVMSPRVQMKGLAMAYKAPEDVESLECSWYYDWYPNRYINDERYVSMSYSGIEVPSREEGYCLFLNEPENRGQANRTPEEAINLLIQLKQKRPNLKYIVGGCGYFGWDWMKEFQKRLIDKNIEVEGYHIHGYVEEWITVDLIRNYWTNVKTLIQGKPLWITEFADVKGEKLEDLLDLIKELEVDRYAYFTNRISGDEGSGTYPSNWPKPECISLIDKDGYLTSRGKIYKNN